MSLIRGTFLNGPRGWCAPKLRGMATRGLLTRRSVKQGFGLPGETPSGRPLRARCDCAHVER